MTLVFVLLSFLFPYESDSLSEDVVLPSPEYIVQDSIIDKLMYSHRQLHLRNRGVQGFRVHIYTDSGNRSKLRTDNEKAKFDERYPLISSYISYVEPNYRLRVGDFRTRLDAVRFLNEVSRHYPGAYVVVERINFPPLATDILKRKKEKEEEKEKRDHDNDTDDD